MADTKLTSFIISEVGPLPEDVQEIMNELFNEYSTEGSTVAPSIAGDKLGAALEAAGYIFPPSTVNLALKIIDQDGSNTIEYNEFLNLVHYLSIVQDIFSRFDRDGNNTIDRKELKNILANHFGFVTFNETTHNYFFKMVDLDEDGHVSYEEFFDFFLYLSLLQQIFKAGDTDNDGVLSAEELHRLLDALRVHDCELTKEDAAEVIKQIDRNGDGKLGFREWVELVFILKYANAL